MNFGLINLENGVLDSASCSGTVSNEIDDVINVFEGLNEDSRSELSSPSETEGCLTEVPEKPRYRKLIIGSHIKVSEGEKTTFTCTLCNHTFSHKHQIRYHDYCVTGKRPLKCHLCGEGFVKKSHLIYHIRTHTGESPFKCSICQKGFKQKSKLNRHLQIHSGSRLTCPYCKKSYADKDSLKKHELKHSKDEFKCQSCSKVYKDKFTLNQHVALHRGASFVCEICGKTFKKRNTLNVHRQTHDDVYPFSCSCCFKTFRTRHDLRHHNIVHDKNNPGHECEKCGVVCARKDNLIRHVRNCHLDTESNLEKKNAKLSNQFNSRPKNQKYKVSVVGSCGINVNQDSISEEKDSASTEETFANLKTTNNAMDNESILSNLNHSDDLSVKGPVHVKENRSIQNNPRSKELSKSAEDIASKLNDIKTANSVVSKYFKPNMEMSCNRTNNTLESNENKSSSAIPQRISVICHTDLFKNPIIAGSPSRDPVIKHLDCNPKDKVHPP